MQGRSLRSRIRSDLLGLSMPGQTEIPINGDKDMDIFGI